VDDILIVLYEPNVHLDKLKNFFTLSSAGSPEQYLGANILKVCIPGDDSGREFWAMSSARSYVRNAVETMKKLLYEDGHQGGKILSYRIQISFF
jgi:hypothetical protein